MTHFLGRLVERARGTAPRVEPIIAPRFAPTPSAETATEVEPAPIAGIVTATESAPPARREARAPEATKPAGRASVRQEKVEAQQPSQGGLHHSFRSGRREAETLSSQLSQGQLLNGRTFFFRLGSLPFYRWLHAS